MGFRAPLALLALGAISCALAPRVAYVYADASPLIDAELELGEPIAGRFPGLVETVRRSSEPNDARERIERVAGEIGPDREKRWPWRLRVALEVYRDAELAELERSKACAWPRGIDPHSIRTQVGRFGRACVSPLAELRNDPEGGSLPSGVYFFFVEATSGNLLVSVWGTSREARSVGEVLAEIARRLR